MALGKVTSAMSRAVEPDSATAPTNAGTTSIAVRRPAVSEPRPAPRRPFRCAARS